MSAATKHAVKKNLQELVPLNALSDTSFKDISRKIVIEEVRSGNYLFRKGDHDNQSVYLLDGKIDLIDGKRRITGGLEAGTDSSRYPVANQQPRPLSARAVTKVVIARIDSMLLDAFLNWNHTSVAEATDISADDNEDWMTRILQSEAFIRIPPAIIQRLIISMQPYPVRAGDVVIQQGEEGEFFYSIHKGRCAVTRRESPGDRDVLLSELSAGDFFGEESLLSASVRNATITMLTDGLLMRLAKKDFIELLQKPLVKSISYQEAVELVDAGAVWIDVRSEQEYACNAFEDSVNIPLNELRDQIPELVFNAKYVICCDTGHRSISAAFVLSHKGFEAYVLDDGLDGLAPDAGAQPQTGGSGSPGISGNDARQGADVIDFNQNRDAHAGHDAAATAGSHISRVAAEAPLPEQSAELEILRGEVELLRQAEQAHQETAGRLAELDSEFGALQDAIDESNRSVSELRSRLKSTTDEKQQLQEQYNTSLKTHAEQLDRLQHELEQSTALAESLRTEIAAAEQDRQQLRAMLGTAESDRAARAGALENELSLLRQQRDALQVEFETASDHAARLEEAHASFCNEQGLLQENLQGELAQAQLRIEALHAELLQKVQQHGEAEASLREQLRTAEALGTELEKSRHQLAKLELELAAAQEQQHTLDDGAKAELAQRIEELESLHVELDQAREHGSELAGRLAGEEEKYRSVRQELEELASRHDAREAELSHQAEQLQQQLDSALTENRRLGDQLVSLQQDRDVLHEEREQLVLQHTEQSDRIGQLTAGKQAVDDAILRLQDEWKAERDDLKNEIEAGSRRLAELQSRLDQSADEAGRDMLQLQEQLQSRIDDYREQLEQQELQQAELQQEQTRATEIRQALEAERDELQRRLDSHLEEGAAQLQKIEELNSLVESLKGAADSQVRELGVRLENERLRADEAESQLREQGSRLESLQAELAAQQEKDAGLLEDAEFLQKQSEELQGQLRQAEERFRSRDLENQEAIKKLYEDLARKNEAERELQGQIERLRKKLDQSEDALRTARHDERESVENIRNELNAERRARAEERAQMAARQRELKEQLVSVAAQHEESISSRQGVFGQKDDDTPDEERTRLVQIIAVQQQTEQQLVEVQDELRRAHEDAAAALQRERESNEADLALARRQKADADAALDQVETQLKQLMQERDAALAEQRSVREQLNTLRAEVEVARGLVNADKQGQEGDPIRLISELKETRRNIEIAVRLRSEAEAQRDRALAQLEELRDKQDKPGSNENRTPADKGTAPPVTTGHASPQGGAGQPVLDAGKVSSASTPAVLPAVKTGRGLSGKLWMTGLVIAVLAAVVFWLAPRIEIVQAPAKTGEAIVGSADTAGTSTGAPAGKPVAGISPPTPGAGSAGLTSKSTSSQPVQQAPAVTQAPAADGPESTVLEPVRSFRDVLASGGTGPLMVELPAASYLMGSAGNSLNFEERPQHPVNLPVYAIGKYEVSFAEYDRFAQATGRSLPHDEGWGRNDRPVINVTWRDAEAYARWLSEQTGHVYRLPSEAEWEFAARGDTTSAFWWDGVTSNNPANCFDCGSRWDGTSTAPVGSFQANKFGLHDTSGNAEEWTADCFHPNYQNAPSDGSAWQSPGCTRRVARGGSYTSPLDSVRSAKRGQYEQDTRLDTLGFRVVRVD